MRARICGALAVSALFAAVPARLGSQQPVTAACTVAAVQAKAPKGTTITDATIVPAANGVPQHCRVEGHVTGGYLTAGFQSVGNNAGWFHGGATGFLTDPSLQVAAVTRC